jgi:hypothetical protein
MSNKKRVRCVETGEVFDSMTAAGLSVGKNYVRIDTGHGDISSHTNISGCIGGRLKTAGGYHWELIHTDSKVSSIIPKEKEEESLPRIYKALGKKPPKQPKIEYPPEGYIYVFRDRWHPENVYKIGSTDNLPGRRSAARTWGPYKCEYYLEVADCKKVESDVHDRLSYCRIVADDLGEEHFEVDLKVAIKTIELANSHDSLRRILDSALAA